MKEREQKTRLVVVNDPLEIESIKRNGWRDIIGGEIAPNVFVAYPHSLAEWRERNAQRVA
jgi:hypothetical protein